MVDSAVKGGLDLTLTLKLIMLKGNIPLIRNYDTFSLQQKTLHMSSFIIHDGNLSLCVNDSVPREAMLLAHCMQNSHDLSSRPWASSEPGDLTIGHDFALGNRPNDVNNSLRKRCHSTLANLIHTGLDTFSTLPVGTSFPIESHVRTIQYDPNLC